MPQVGIHLAPPQPPCRRGSRGVDGSRWGHVFSHCPPAQSFSLFLWRREHIKKNKIEQRKETGYQKSKGNDVFTASVSSPGVLSSEGKRDQSQPPQNLTASETVEDDQIFDELKWDEETT